MSEDKKPSLTTETEKPIEDEVQHPPRDGVAPTPDDVGDPQRQKESSKTTQRQE